MWRVQKKAPANKAYTTAKSANERENKEGANTQCHCMTQGQIIHGIKHAHASKESLKGLQLWASSDRNLAGLWPHCWFAHRLCETPTRLCQLEQQGSSSIQRTTKRKAKGHISFWSFLMCYWFGSLKFGCLETCWVTSSAASHSLCM